MNAKSTLQIVIHLFYLTILTYEQDTTQFDGLSSFSSNHHHHHHSTSMYSDSFPMMSADRAPAPRDSFRPDPDYMDSDMNGSPSLGGPRNDGTFVPLPPPPPSIPNAADAKNLMPQGYKAGRKSRWIDPTEKKFFRNITNAQLELRKEIRNTNLRIEVVHKNVKNVRKHLFGIEVLGSFVFVAKMIFPIIRDYFLGKSAVASVNVAGAPRKPAARPRQQ